MTIKYQKWKKIKILIKFVIKFIIFFLTAFLWFKLKSII